MKKLTKFLTIIVVLLFFLSIGYLQLDPLQKVRIHQKFAKLRFASEMEERTPFEIPLHFVPEGSARLLYTPDRPVSDFYAQLLANQPYLVAQNTESFIRYEGLGMQGKGYIYAVELEPDWHYLEIFLPT
ncbi:MAG: hypothetical protein IJ968_10060 [Clostridia bacterium]|nr:hypothetical protein [Clostridia bacterium]